MKKNHFYRAFIVAFCFSMGNIFTACTEDNDSNEISKQDEKKTTQAEEKTPKYIFYFIGDGMGSPQVNIAEAATFDTNFRLLKSTGVGTGSLNINKFPSLGMQTTHAEDRYVTGSAASATALACGYKTTINTISMSGDHTKSYPTIAEMAKQKGMRVGIVSSVSIDHATPACFYAHSDTRNWYNYIASQMDDSGFDYFGGGFAKGDFSKYKDASTPGKRVPSDFTPVEVLAEMKEAGYTIATNKAELEAVQNGTKCWAYTDQYDGAGALPYEIDRKASDLSLADFTQKGIDLLANDKGFFLMVEGGKIDWACHANDAASAAHDMIAFDNAIGKALDFYNQHPDETLIVVTGDHECGGLALGFAGTKYQTAFTFLNHQKVSYDAFIAEVVSTWNVNTSIETALPKVSEYFGLGNAKLGETTAQGEAIDLALTDSEKERLAEALAVTLTPSSDRDYSDEEKVIYGGYDPFTVTVTHILNQKAGIDWTSYSHTGVPIPVFAKGVGSALFDGYYDNTDVAKKIIAIAELEKK